MDRRHLTATVPVPPVVVPLTVAIVAEAFLCLDAGEQADFFRAVVEGAAKWSTHAGVQWLAVGSEMADDAPRTRVAMATMLEGIQAGIADPAAHLVVKRSADALLSELDKGPG